MAKYQKKKSSDNTTPFPKVGCALIQVRNERLSADTDGKLSEIPELLVPVEKLREAVKKYGGDALNVSTQPYISVGEYGVQISLVQAKQTDNEISNRYHALTENLRHSYAIIVKNAAAERPLSLNTLSIPGKEVAVLKALGLLEKYKTGSILVTDDGKVSEFPRVESKFLNASKGESPDAKKIDNLLVGIDVDARKQLLVRLEKSHWLRLEFTSYAQVCEKLPKGVLVKGLAEVIDGVWVMQNGELIDAPSNMELPF